MPIAYVGGKIAAVPGSTSATPTTVALDSGLTGGIGGPLQAGDFIVVSVSVGHQGRTPNPVIRAVDDTAYTAIGSDQNITVDTQDIFLKMAYRFHDGTANDDDVEIGQSGNAADALAYAIQVFRGVDPTTPLDGVTPTTADGQNTGRADPPSITPATAGAITVHAGAGGAAAGAVFTSSDLQSFRTVNSPDTNDTSHGVGYIRWTGSGAINPAGFLGGSTNANNSWAAKSIVLRPEAATRGTVSLVAQGVEFLTDDASPWTTNTIIDVPSGTDLLVVICGVRLDASGTINAATWNGDAMTIVAEIGADATQRFALAYIINPDPGTNTLSVSLAAGQTASLVLGAFAFDDVDTSMPFLEILSTTGTSTTVSLAPFGTAGGYPFIVCNSINSPARTHTDGGSQTSLTNASYDSTYTFSASTEDVIDNNAQSLSYTISGSVLQREAVSFVIVPALDTGYDPLDAETGTFVLTGGDASLEYDRIMAADAASYVLTGVDAGVEYEHVIAADVATFVHTGQDSTFEYDRVMEADAAAFVLTGVDASFEYDRIMDADVATFVLTGVDATLQHARQMVAEPGEFVLTGIDNSFLYNKAIVADVGEFVLTGIDVSFEYDRIMVADAGSFVLTGIDNAFVYSKNLLAEAGTFNLTGIDSTFEYDRVMDVDVGEFTLTGQDTNLEYERTINAEVASFVLTGIDNSWIRSYRYNAIVGEYVLTGIDATFDETDASTLDADSGSFVLTGIDAGLIVSRKLDADVDSFALSGADAGLIYARVLDASAASYVINGQDAELQRNVVIAADVATFVYSVNDAEFSRAYVITTEQATFTLVGIDAELQETQQYYLDASTGEFVWVGVDAVITVQEAEFVPTRRNVAVLSPRNSVAVLPKYRSNRSVLEQFNRKIVLPAETAREVDLPKRNSIIRL